MSGVTLNLAKGERVDLSTTKDNLLKVTAGMDIHPNVENTLNYAAIRDLSDISKLIRSDNFLLNTRTVKYILNSGNNQFRVFCDYQSKKFLRTLYHAAIGNGYHLVEAYKHNLNHLKSLI